MCLEHDPIEEDTMEFNSLESIRRFWGAAGNTMIAGAGARSAGMSRRTFLVTASGVATAMLAGPHVPLAAAQQGRNPTYPGVFTSISKSLIETLPDPVKLSDIVSMSAVDMAKRSQLVMSAYQELIQMALSLRNQAYRKPMLDILRNPKVTFLALYPTRADREAIRNELARFEYMSTEDDVDELFPPNNLNVQPYYASCQSHDDFYHNHPGGMAITCAVNARLSEYHTHLYQEHFGIPVDRDLAVAGLAIHEYPKAWLYYWKDDGSYGIEPRTLGGNVHTHDVYVVAEMLYRGAPRELVVGVAAAHSFGSVDVKQEGKETRFLWPGYEYVAKFLHAGALLAQRDAVEAGLLERGRDGALVFPPQPIEIWNCHLSDMNWPYSSGAAHKYVRPLLVQMASDTYGIRSPETREFRQLKNYAYSQIGLIPLYEVLVREGEGAFRATVQRLVARG
jgi:hypothetical protein